MSPAESGGRSHSGRSVSISGSSESPLDASDVRTASASSGRTLEMSKIGAKEVRVASNTAAIGVGWM